MRIWRCIYSCLLFFVLITGCTVSEHSKSDSENTQSKELTSNNTESELQAITALTGDELVKPYVRSKNSGSAKELVGDILIVNVMVDDPESEINQQVQDEILDEVRKAGDWLETEAKKRGKEARIITGKDDKALIIKYNYPKVIVDGALAYDEILNMMKELKTEIGACYQNTTEKYNTKNIAFIFSVNKNGRSFACAGSNDEIPEGIFSIEETEPHYFLPFDICIAYTMCQWEKSLYGLYAHELLHLFGAVDLYADYTAISGETLDMAVEKQSLIGNYFPEEIMLDSAPPMTICDLTAYLIGWEDTVPIKYLYFLYQP